MDFLSQKVASYYPSIEEELLNEFLLKAVEKGNIHYVKLFLSKGGDPNYKGIKVERDLDGFWFCSFGNNDGFGHHKGYNPLIAAVILLKEQKGKAKEGLEIVKILLNAGADPSVLEMSRVPYRVAKLLDQADPNLGDDMGWTVLMTACRDGDLEAVRSMIQDGANVNKTDDVDFTAIMAAVNNGHLEIVRELIKAGANVNTRSDRLDNLTVLEYCHPDRVQFENEEIRLLIEKELISAGLQI